MPATVSLFVPCFVDQLAPQVGVDMVRVLRRVGYNVTFPSEQTCCGQPAFNTGYWDEARPVARRFVQVFHDAELVVCPSGSCTTMVRSFYPELLAGTDVHADAVALGKRTYEFSEFLTNVAKVTDVGASFPQKVAIHDSCHALRELHVHDGPRTLLKGVRGLELVEIAHGEECCGFGGTFSVKMHDISSAMGRNKAEFIEATGASYVTAVDSSCLMQIEGVLRRRNSNVKTIHLASILAQEAK